MSYTNLTFERHGSIGLMTFNRPEILNAASKAFIDECIHVYDALRTDHEIRVLIITGSGRAFSAGGDLEEVERTLSDPDQGPIQNWYNNFQRSISDSITKMRSLPQPIIAAVGGLAVGGGLGIALASDLVIAGKSARFSAGFLKIGVSAADGSTYFLSKHIGLKRAAEYIYTGRVFDAEEAERIGIVTKIVPDDELEIEAFKLAQAMIDNSSPFGLQITKELLNKNLDATLESSLLSENMALTLCLNSADGREGRKAFLEKRSPLFTNR